MNFKLLFTYLLIQNLHSAVVMIAWLLPLVLLSSCWDSEKPICLKMFMCFAVRGRTERYMWHSLPVILLVRERAKPRIAPSSVSGTVAAVGRIATSVICPVLSEYVDTAKIWNPRLTTNRRESLSPTTIHLLLVPIISSLNNDDDRYNAFSAVLCSWMWLCISLSSLLSLITSISTVISGMGGL